VLTTNDLSQPTAHCVCVASLRLLLLQMQRARSKQQKRACAQRKKGK